jgi:hypothetical protein
MADETKPPPKDAPPSTPESQKRNKQLMTGVAVGIGSAAIVAALLYANRSRKTEKASNSSTRRWSDEPGTD